MSTLFFIHWHLTCRSTIHTRHSFLRFAPSFSRTGANAPLAVRPTCQLTHHWRNKSATAALRFKSLQGFGPFGSLGMHTFLDKSGEYLPVFSFPPQCCCLISADYHCPSGPPVLSGHNPLFPHLSVSLPSPCPFTLLPWVFLASPSAPSPPHPHPLTSPSSRAHSIPVQGPTQPLPRLSQQL